MPRPRHCRKVKSAPKAEYFKPRGVPLSELTETYLSLEGLEAMRLADLEGLTMAEAAAGMGISRHTFGRTLAEARKAVARALVHGQALCIRTGDSSQLSTAQPGCPDKPLELSMTKIAVSSEGPSLDDMVDTRFGRAAGFVVVDMETLETSYLDNGQSQAMAHGAGIQSAESIANAGAGVLLTGIVGPKAFEALCAAGVKVGQNLEGLSVREAVERYKSGQVPFADSPNK